jgi:hypothetical protein
VDRVIRDFLNVEIDRGGPRSLGIGCHLEFFWGGGLELCEQEGWGCEGEKQEYATNNVGNPHDLAFCLQIA